MTDIRYDISQRDEALDELRAEHARSDDSVRAQHLELHSGVSDAVRLKRQRLLKMRQIAARRRAGMQLQTRFAAARSAAARAKGSRSQKLLTMLKQRKHAGEQAKNEKQEPHEKPHGDHQAHGAHHGHEHMPHGEHAHGPHEAGAHRRLERLDRDSGQGSGSQQQQQERPPTIKVKLSKRISPSAIRSDLRHLADQHQDEPLKLEIQMRLAWTRTCLSFGANLSHDPSAAVTPVILGASLDLIGARLRHTALRDATRQTGLLGVKHQLQTVQDEPDYRYESTREPSQRRKDLNVLKPLLVLHGERPYTRAQMHLSVCRVRTLLFATGQALDPASALRAERAERAARTANAQRRSARKNDQPEQAQSADASDDKSTASS
jgi:hypothetical protein